MTPCPLNEEDFRIRLALEEQRRDLTDPYVRQQYELIRDVVTEFCLEILESAENA